MDKFISCDWGTSNFRLRLVEAASLRVLTMLESNDGISATYNAWLSADIPREKFYGDILLDRINQLAENHGSSLRDVPVIISGMASSSLGIMELPYAELPLDHVGSAIGAAKMRLSDNVFIIRGVRTVNDVMRGEETQWIGLMQDEYLAGLPHLLCILPGTHSKHINVRHGIMQNFHTYMTGEFFQILSGHSVLKNSVGRSTKLSLESQHRAFVEGVLSSNKSSLLNQAFMVRTNQLFDRFSTDDNTFFLSGLLIGAELQNADAPEILIAANKDIAGLYQIASEALSNMGRLHIVTGDDFDKAIIKGQFVIFNSNTGSNE